MPASAFTSGSTSGPAPASTPGYAPELPASRPGTAGAPRSRLPHRGSRLTRRSLLAAVLGGTALAAGCTLGEDQPAPGSRPEQEPPTDPDVAVAAAALAQQERMIALLRATRERHGRIAGRLDAALSAHRQHATMLRDAVPDEAATTAPSSTPSAAQAEPDSVPSARRTAPGLDVPRRPRSALQALVRAEEDLGAAMRQHAFRAESGGFARVLGSMAASCTQHAFVLRGSLARGGDR